MLIAPRTFRLTLLVLCFALSSNAIAATISGRITDASSGKPVVYATIRLVGMTTEVHTDADGRYVFNAVPAGRYTVTVSFAGYTDYSIGMVETSADGAKTLDAALQPDIAPMYEERLITDERIKPEESTVGSSTLRDSPIRLGDLPIRGYEDYIAIQPGTVRRFYGAPVHVRGGRIEEFGYSVDGFSQQDPFTGRSFTTMNANAIDDIRFSPGYSDPSHGWLASGRADVTTRETRATGGSFEAITDNFHGEKSDYNLYALDLSGPILAKSPAQLTYAVASEYRTLGTRTLGGPGDWNYLGSWHGNLRWRPSDRTSALIGTRGSYEDWKSTPRAYLFDAAHAPRGIDENYSVFGSLSSDLATRTNLSASLNWFSSAHRMGDGVHFDDVWAYGRPNGNPRFDQTTLFWSWDDMNLDQDSLTHQRYIPVHTPVVESTFAVTLPDGQSTQKSFIIRGDEGNVWDEYFEQKGSYLGGRAELSHSKTRGSLAKIGIEFQRHTVRTYSHQFQTLVYQGTEGGFTDVDRYGYDEFGALSDDDGINGAKHPLFVGSYANENISWKELTFDLGVRWDHFDYDTKHLINPSRPLDPFNRAAYADTAHGLTEHEKDSLRQTTQVLEDDELEDVKAIDRISPRLAAAYAISEMSTLHFTFGRYVQRPAFKDLYTNFDFLEYKVRTGGYAYTFGNANLKPVENLMYEAGWAQHVGDALDVDISAFTKNTRHLVGAATQPSFPNSFTSLFDMGDVTVKGLEFGAQAHPMPGIAAQVNYTLSDISDDDHSFANTQSNVAWTTAEPRVLRRPFTFEQKHRFVAMIDLRGGPESGPAIGETHLLGNVGVTLLFEAGSGFPYSPVNVYNEVTLGSISPSPTGQTGSENTPATHRFDLKANKAISIRGADLELYLWVINLFNRENVVDVYNGSGKPDNTGWLDTGEGEQFVQNNNSIHDSSFLTGEQKYMLRQNDPANFDIPRQIRFGMKVGF